MPFLGKVPSQLVDSDVDIDGGSIDGVSIGSVTANAGAFTNLTATGTLTLPDDAISGDDIDGGTISNVAISGTTASFSGDLTVDTNTLYVDSTSNRVGIGDITPAEKLTVEGNVRINKQPTATNGITWDLNTTNFGSIKMDGTENMLFDVDKSTTDFIFGSGSSEYVRFENTGRVGIGVTEGSPVSQLHLQQTLSNNETATYIALENRNGSGASANSVGIDFHAGAAISASADRRARILAEGSTSGGNIDLAFHVSNSSSSSEAMRITNTKYVGIGEDEPQSKLVVRGVAGADSRIHVSSGSSGQTTFDGSGSGLLLTAANMNTTSKFTPAIQFGTEDVNLTTTNPKVGAAINGIAAETFSTDTDSGMHLGFYTTPVNNGTGQEAFERMRVDSAGNVLIGAVAGPRGRLHVSNNADIDMDYLASGHMHIDGNSYGFGIALNTDGAQLYTNSASRDLIFGVNETEVMRLTPSNMIVGKQTTAIEDVGTSVLGTGRIISTADGDDVAVLNRKTSDGEIAVFKKDGLTVGSTAARSGSLCVNLSSRAGISGSTGYDAVLPADGNSAIEDATIDLGIATYRFRNLHLSSGVYLGGTSNAHHLDDYEEGAWTPVLAGGVSFSSSNCLYIKVGNLVTVTGYIYSVADYTSATDMIVSGLPYSTNNARGVGGCMFRDINNSAITQLNSYVSANSSSIYFYASQNNGGSWDVLEYSSGDAGKIDIIFTLSYPVT